MTVRVLRPAHTWCGCGAEFIDDCRGRPATRHRPRPLTLPEREHVYDVQASLQAVKTCSLCAEQLPVELFEAYGVTRCDPCIGQMRSNRSTAAAWHSRRVA